MFGKIQRGLQQIHQKLVSFSSLHGPKCGDRILSKGLLKELPLKSPPAAVWHECGIEVNAKTETP